MESEGGDEKMTVFNCPGCGKFYNDRALSKCPDCGEPNPNWPQNAHLLYVKLRRQKT